MKQKGQLEMSQCTGQFLWPCKTLMTILTTHKTCTTNGTHHRCNTCILAEQIDHCIQWNQLFGRRNLYYSIQVNRRAQTTSKVTKQ